MSAPSLGPVLSATVTTGQLDHSIRAYQEHLRLDPGAELGLGEAQAASWGCDALSGNRMNWLSNELGEPWLRLIEVPGLQPLNPFRHRGWFSLEISVTDVDGLWPALEGSPFRVIGPPANLDVSDAIRAMQLLGPAGEVLYLTEVKAEVPPFELPFPRCRVDRLFIPVLLSLDRASTLGLYQSLAGRAGLEFDTKISVINRGRDWPVDTRHPVATLQLRGRHLIEIDQISGLAPRPADRGLPAGIAMISFAVDQLPQGSDRHVIEDGPNAGRRATLLTGAAGELIELVEIPTLDPELEETPCA